MTLTTLPEQPLRPSRSQAPRSVRSPLRAARRAPHERHAPGSAIAPASATVPAPATAPGSALAPASTTGLASATAAPAIGHRALGRYADPEGRPREVLALPGHAGSVLVVDRDAATFGDRRLVAHLAADEPPENASVVCHHYLQDPRRCMCRPISPEDLLTTPFPAGRAQRHLAQGVPVALEMVELRDRRGHLHRLEALDAGMSVPELRWCRYPPQRAQGEPESVRDAVAGMESYEPVRALTARALARHRSDLAISVAVLRAELRRLDGSRIVLNRGLRGAVLWAMRSQGLSMSEIAFRCGRIKRDSRGNASGETSWLARRVGISAESGEGVPTPWIHSEVLALIARSGLGVSPREVEL
jgi:hypothetical protein